MKFLKDNLKVTIAFLVGVILASGIVYAATSAKEVTYSTNENVEIKNVAEALNDLYNKYKDSGSLIYTNSNNYTNANSSITLEKSVNRILVECYDNGDNGMMINYYVVVNKGEKGICGYRFTYNNIPFERSRPVELSQDGKTIIIGESYQVELDNTHSVIGNLPTMLYIKNIYKMN